MASLRANSALVTRSYLVYPDEMQTIAKCACDATSYVFLRLRSPSADTKEESGTREHRRDRNLLPKRARTSCASAESRSVFMHLDHAAREDHQIAEHYPSSFGRVCLFCTLRAVLPDHKICDRNKHVSVLVLCWFGLLSLLRVVRSIDIFIRTLLLARAKIVALCISFGLLFYGYTSGFYRVLDANLEAYQSISSSLSKLLFALFDIGGARSVNANIDGSYTTTTQMLFCAFFLVLNIFLMANLVVTIIFKRIPKSFKGSRQKHRAVQSDARDDEVHWGALRQRAKIHTGQSEAISFAFR